MEVVASLSQGRTAAAQCGLFTHKSVPVIFETPCVLLLRCYKLIFSDVYECCKALSVSTAVRISRRIKKEYLGYAQTSYLVCYCTFERVLLEDVGAE